MKKHCGSAGFGLKIPAAGTIKYRPEIDGLRALAVLPIVLFHAGVPGFSGGYVGVDVFYVISGYLITGIIAPQIGEKRFSLLTFYERRVRRIAPASAIALAATTVAGSLILMPADMAELGRSLIATAFFSSNIFFWQQSGYFDTASALKPLLHTWSLGVEEQFYLFYPPTLIIITRLFKTGLALALAFAACASFALCVWLTAYRPDAAFYLLPPRAWELLVGGVLYTSKLQQPSRAAAEISSAGGIILILVAVFTFSSRTIFPGAAALLPCAGSLLVIYGGRARVSSWILTAPPIRWVGRVSYSLYLWHWPVMALYRYRFEAEPEDAMKALLIAGMFFAAWLSWKFVEEPFRTRTVLPRRGRLFATAGAATLVLACTGAALLSSGGWPSRYPAAVVQQEAFAKDRDWSRKCVGEDLAAVRAGRLCVIGASGVRPDTIIWGDSHAWALERAYELALARAGQAAYVASRDGCLPLPHLKRLIYAGQCEDGAAAVLELIGSRKLKRVILVGGWGWYFSDALLTDGWSSNHTQTATGEAINRQFHALLSQLHREGVEVLVQDPVPGTRIPPPRALAQHVAYGTGPDIRWSRNEYFRRNAGYFAMVKRNERLIRGRIMFWPILCRSGYCAALMGGKPLYFDGSHPSLSTFDFAAGAIQPALERH